MSGTSDELPLPVSGVVKLCQLLLENQFFHRVLGSSPALPYVGTSYSPSRGCRGEVPRSVAATGATSQVGRLTVETLLQGRHRPPDESMRWAESNLQIQHRQPEERAATDWTTDIQGVGQYAEVNGINLYFETHGTGRPLVLLHGGLGSGEMFGPILPPSRKTTKSSPSTCKGTACRHRPPNRHPAHGRRRRRADRLPRTRQAGCCRLLDGQPGGVLGGEVSGEGWPARRPRRTSGATRSRPRCSLCRNR